MFVGLLVAAAAEDGAPQVISPPAGGCRCKMCTTNRLFGSKKSLTIYHDMGRQILQYVRIAESPNLQKYTAGELSCRRLSQKVYFNPLMWVNTKLPSHFQIYNCKLSTSTCYKLRRWLMIHLIFFANRYYFLKGNITSHRLYFTLCFICTSCFFPHHFLQTTFLVL